MCHYVSYCVPVTHMLINADLCLIMLIYNRATGVLLTDCRKKKTELATFKDMMLAIVSLSVFRMKLLKEFYFYIFLGGDYDDKTIP